MLTRLWWLVRKELSILLGNTLCLLLLAAFWLALTARKTRRTLE
ncbi:hypothetical protein [Aeromonas enteropelogenes]